jgi:excisionase family DNA binding protein
MTCGSISRFAIKGVDDVDNEQPARVSSAADNEPITEAPSARAKALRDEIFGSALTLDEAAYVLGLDRTTVAKYLRENSLVGFQIGREWLIPEDELRAFVRRTIEQRRAEASAATLGLRQREGPHLRVGWDLLFGQRRPRQYSHFERFTEPARLVLSRAQQEAQALRHDFLGTEHLLLGLLAADEPSLVRVLDDLALDRTEIRNEVYAAVEGQTGSGAYVRGEIGLTRRAKKALELAVEESQRRQRDSTGPEDLLLGLVREGEGVPAVVLKEHDVDLEAARAAVARVARS